jgi:hypothetical protein
MPASPIPASIKSVVTKLSLEQYKMHTVVNEAFAGPGKRDIQQMLFNVSLIGGNGLVSRDASGIVVAGSVMNSIITTVCHGNHPKPKFVYHNGMGTRAVGGDDAMEDEMDGFGRECGNDPIGKTEDLM